VPTNVQISGNVVQTPVHRLGVNLGDQDYWDSGQMLKNLVFRNPGFEGLKYRVIFHCAAVTANTCTDDNEFNGQATGFWNNQTYQVLSGTAAGTNGTVVVSTNNHSTCGGCGPIIQFDKSVNMAVGDYVSLTTNYMTGNGDAGWWDDVSHGGTITTETTDISPNSPGKQAIALGANTSGTSVSIAQYFDSNSISFIQLNGTYQVAFRAKGVGGNNQLNVNVTRLQSGNAAFLNQTLTLTNTWQDYTLNFSATETGSAVGTVQLVFEASGGSVELDDVSLEQTNSSSTNTTPFRDDVVNALKTLNPGTIRMMAAGDALGSDIPNQLAVPFARYREGYNADYSTQTDVAYGIHEFLQLCAAVGADPWITIPTATTPQEMTEFIQYLTGTGSDSFSSLRIARGQTQPWTTVFSKIHIELGNEVWNGIFKGESMNAPGYPQWANSVFGAARQTSGFKASQFDLILDGWSSVPSYNAMMLAESTQHDSIDIAPYLLYSANNEAMPTMFGALFAEPEVFESAGGEVYQNLQVGTAASRPAAVSVYETNLSPIEGTITQAQLDLLTPSVGAGIATADHMLQMMRLGVQYQNTFALQQYEFKRSDSSVVKLWGIVVDMGTTNRRRPQFLTQSLANSVIAGNMLQTSQTGANPTWNQPLSSDGVVLNGAHYLQSFAFLNGTQISTVLFNLNQTTALPVVFSGQNAPSGTVQMTQITSGGISDNNETATVVQPTTQTLSAFNAAAGLSLPPYSMTVLTWTSTVTQAPQFSVPAGTYSATQTVTISDKTPGATIYYTTNGTTPTTSSNQYTGPITVAATQTLNAIAIASNFTLSPVATSAYVIQPVAATPVFSVAPGIYSTSQTVAISDTLAGAAFYYTTDGSTPTTASKLYTGPITVSTNETLSAIAVAANYTNSLVATAVYTIAPPTAQPVFSTASGTYTTTQYVFITDTTPGAVIYYTTNGTTPTTSSTQYTAAVTVSASMTLKAIAIASGYSSSAVTSAAYTISSYAATPVLSPAPGTYNGPQTVSLSDSTPGAKIYYTTDGSTPTTSSKVYTAPFSVTSSTYVASVAVASGYATSFYGTGSYNMVAALPTLSVPGGTYSGPQTVAVSSMTPQSIFYYTTDGTTPSGSSKQYTAPIVASSSMTLKVIGAKSGYTNSAVTTATYTLGSVAATPTFSPVTGKYAAAQKVTISDTTAGATIYYTTNGVAPSTSSAKYTGPITVNSSELVQAIAVVTGSSNSSVGSAEYTIGSQTAAPVFSVSGGTYYATQSVSMSDSTSGAVMYYTTNGTTPTTSSTKYTGPIAVSSAETVEAIAIAPGYVSSAVNSATYALTAATPVLSVAAGTYGSAQTLLISDATAGAKIYYTTNGTTPTTASTLYTGSITVSATETVKAIAVVTGFANSAVISATYTISLTTPAPVFSLAAGTYSSAQTVTITDATSGAAIYYTTNGTTPTTSSSVYASPLTVSASETVKALAVAHGVASAVSTVSYTISQTTAISFASGFTASKIRMNGSAKVVGTALQLTSGVGAQAGTGWYPTKVSTSNFSTDFDFQLPSSTADGFTFTLQNEGGAYWALGANGSGLGYQGITNSVAVAFDLYQSGVTGAETLSILTGGNSVPSAPISLVGTGINLHNGNVFHAHLAYSGTTLTVTLTDNTTKASVTKTFTINLTNYIGSSTAYVGFTGSTGGLTSIQNILDWTYSN
jgi:hypothetical protein